MDAINDPNTPNMDAPESGDSPERERMARGDRTEREMQQSSRKEGEAKRRDVEDPKVTG